MNVFSSGRWAHIVGAWRFESPSRAPFPLMDIILT